VTDGKGSECHTKSPNPRKFGLRCNASKPQSAILARLTGHYVIQVATDGSAAFVDGNHDHLPYDSARRIDACFFFLGSFAFQTNFANNQYPIFWTIS
jgi:hypothetical protein